MGREIEYQWMNDGENVEVSSTPTPDVNMELTGYADLINGRATVQSYHAGKSIILTRNQDNTTAIGNLYIYSPATITQVSFEIRSTNNSDNGTVFWQIID